MFLDRKRQEGRLGLIWRMALCLGLLYCIYLVTTRAIAHGYFRQADLEGVRKAIEWDPGNPRYYAALARVLERSIEGEDLDEAIRLYETATRLSPHRARYWAELGGAYELAGRREDARRAYERAQQLFPNSPRINWQLANFCIRQGQTAKALSSFQKVLLGDPKLRPPAFDLAWRAGVDADLILEKMIPPNAEIFFQYLNYLVRREHIDEAEQAWARILELGLPLEPRSTFPYLDALIQHKRVEELTTAWGVVAERNPIRIRQRRFDSNLVTNGDFESEILNGGLDWRVHAAEGAVVSVDSLTFFDGARSLRIGFDGKRNVNYHHVLQYMPVEPNTRYRFMGYMRTQGIATDSGLRFQLYDAYGRDDLLLSTENVVGTSSWSPQQLEFRTNTETRLLLLRVVRPPSRKFDNQIAGTVWIDRVSLSAVE